MSARLARFNEKFLLWSCLILPQVALNVIEPLEHPFHIRTSEAFCCNSLLAQNRNRWNSVWWWWLPLTRWSLFWPIIYSPGVEATIHLFGAISFFEEYVFKLLGASHYLEPTVSYAEKVSTNVLSFLLYLLLRFHDHDTLHRDVVHSYVEQLGPSYDSRRLVRRIKSSSWQVVSISMGNCDTRSSKFLCFSS